MTILNMIFCNLDPSSGNNLFLFDFWQKLGALLGEEAKELISYS